MNCSVGTYGTINIANIFSISSEIGRKTEIVNKTIESYLRVIVQKTKTIQGDGQSFSLGPNTGTTCCIIHYKKNNLDETKLKDIFVKFSI